MSTKYGKAGARYQGFGKMKAEEPERFKEICRRAGRRAQKIHGGKIRWDLHTARKWAPVGGRALVATKGGIHAKHQGSKSEPKDE